ncbi:hypothetical protein SMD44_p20011 (plasmid) [Streptomyces alboflavus]|uniref:DUF6545 domain-containing protein n=1 Tax=Streptomyces alboflavus TaxID=67267 RepID=A0A291W473_9ACTN|nr:MAB_1171c family putative transporter [Streptomyces alboflavus]ATM24794.1 hypothetical protein SMD44_p20011 [Streptomyces alboflavus]
MPTDDLIDLSTTIPLWVVVAVRVYKRPSTSGQRAFLATMVILAIGATLRLSAVEDLFADATGLQDAAVLPKHLAIMVACTILLGWVDSVVPRGEREPWRRWVAFRPRVAVLAVFSIVATAAFPYAAPAITAADGSKDFASAQYGDVAGTVHLVCYLLSMAAALAPAAFLYFTVARRTNDRLLRLCMRFLGLGAFAGCLYPAYRISYLAFGFASWKYPLSEPAFHLGGSLFQFVTITFVLIGSSVRAVDLVVRGIRQRRGLIALRPLWVELVSVLPPDAILRHLKKGSSPHDDRLRLGDLYGRLDERVVDISDAVFELLPWVSEDLRREALIAARGAGLHGAEARAAREAICLRVARLKAVQGESYAVRPASTLLTLRHDLLANASWLARVSRHYTSPHIAEIANTLSGHTATRQEAIAA